MSAKIQINYITNLVYCEIHTNSRGREVYFNTILNHPKDKVQIFDTGLGGCYSGLAIKDCMVVPDSYRISGFWTKNKFNALVKALKKSGAKVNTDQDTI